MSNGLTIAQLHDALTKLVATGIDASHPVYVEVGEGVYPLQKLHYREGGSLILTPDEPPDPDEPVGSGLFYPADDDTDEDVQDDCPSCHAPLDQDGDCRACGWSEDEED